METDKVIFVKCPSCNKKINYNKSAFRPFCSQRCKTQDLAKWADGSYNIAQDTANKEETFPEDNQVAKICLE